MEPMNSEERLKYAFNDWIRDYRYNAWLELDSSERTFLIDYHFKNFMNLLNAITQEQ